MPSDRRHTPLQIAVTFEALTAPLAALLAKQRAEEPETPVRLIETSAADQVQGLKGGAYSAGISIVPSGQDALPSLPLWRDELAIAVPVRSPLLAFPRVPLEEVARYPLVMWCPGSCEAINQHVESLLRPVEPVLNIMARAKSFELLTVLVAAGYGMGFSTMSRIAASRPLDIVMRPLLHNARHVTTYLLRTAAASPAIDRFVERARAIPGPS
ncbi:LysR family substrate-binding domain-containing protein [Phytopseudomonas dryadis]|uniref:LysR family substrate-binding domain-containing protein n=1 Tax=Phytopseudomonas dryadis TaxID=2487520 RepID=UPI0013F16828|nr:LysR family substrate-binding domain-containing protein [Pseudomonas dryadis]